MKDGALALIFTLGCMLLGFAIGRSSEADKHHIFYNRGFETGSMATYLSIQKDVVQGKFPETMEQALVDARQQYFKMGGSLSTNR